MPYIPGQKDSLFEAVRKTITGQTPEGRYARNALGYTPLQESVRVMEIPPEARETTLEMLASNSGKMGPPGFRYGMRVYYDGVPYRVESFKEDDDYYKDLMLTLVDDECTTRIAGVAALEITYPTETTAVSESVLGEQGDTQFIHKALQGWISRFGGFRSMKRDFADLWKNLDSVLVYYVKRLHGSEDEAQLKELHLALTDVYSSLNKAHGAILAVRDAIRKADRISRR